MHGKQPRQPFHSVGKRHVKPLELVHSDLCESNVLSLGGGKHVLTFVDDHTRHCRVYILSNKTPANVLKAFKEYQAWAERQSGHKVKVLRTDRGTEYMGDMITYIKSKGIEHNPTAAYSSQSNGVAERMNRTLFDMACPMLDAAEAPLELWGEAILTACHIRNRLPTRSLINNMSPHEAWTGAKPTVRHIRKFGCAAYRHINKKTGRKRFDKKSMVGHLVGYDSTGIYRIYHPGTQTIKVSRDVVFSEAEFFGIRQVNNSDDILPLDNDIDVDIDETSSEAELDREQDEVPAAAIIHDEIIVEPPPTSSHAYGTTSKIRASNRRQRRAVARAFKAILKGSNLPTNYHEAMSGDDAQLWEAAMQKEYDSIIKNNTWKLVPRPTKAKVVKSRWVMLVKDNGLHKARFCAKGFTQRWGEDYDETFAPVAKYTSIRTLLALLAGRRDIEVHQMDVNTAFLCSDIDEVVYVEQPEGYKASGKEDWVCLLNKALYGLKQSPRAWFQCIAPVLIGFDFQQCDSDPCIFVHTNVNGQKMYIALYVDDLIIAGENKEDIATVK